jgi:hypothetical protein
MPSLLPAALGLLFGVRHALEPDHLAAVSTLASEQRTWRSSLGVGLSWGLGHAFTVLVFGGALALLEVRVDPGVTRALELLVAAVIFGLGVRAVRQALREAHAGAIAVHLHGAHEHAHAAGGDHLHAFGLTLATRPLLIGALHGLAGSGALVALVLLELDGFLSRLLYLTLFGAGAAVSMGLLTALAGVPLSRLQRLRTRVLGTAGAMSIAVGLVWGAAAL